MDQGQLEWLLSTIDQHQCWVKPIGWSERPIATTDDFSRAVLRLDFAKRSRQLQKDDILLVYAVGHRMLCYIGTCNTPMKEASEQDIAVDPWRARWRYWIKVINHSPSFGRAWARHNVRLFDELERHNTEHPAQAFGIGGLNHGHDKLKVPSTFAAMVIRMVMALDDAR